MEERKDPKATPAAEGGGRDAEATSDETLGDLEATTKVKTDKRDSAAAEGGGASGVPSPDGTFDEAGPTADERESGDPM